MRKVYNWQKVAFRLELLTFLKHFEGYSLNYLQFRLLIDQARLMFLNDLEENRCKILFNQRGQISKEQLVSRLKLVESVTKHCQKHYIIKLTQSQQEIQHAKHRCFQYWINHMRKKFGYFHIWFEQLCKEKDIRRVPIHRFLHHIAQSLKKTPHLRCHQKISLFFEKNKASQVESQVFMNTILIHKNLIKDNYELKNIKYESASTNFASRESKIGSQLNSASKGERSTTVFSKWSSISPKNRYKNIRSCHRKFKTDFLIDTS